MKYKSIFKNELYSFIEYKKSLGYKYNSITLINKFDVFCFNKNLNSKIISQDLYEEWIAKKDNESNNMCLRKYCFIKNFTRYLIMNDYENIYYNDEYRIKDNSKFIPHIFNEDEINLIFKELKTWNIKTYDSNDKHNFIFLFTILYCCGLRISEALNIKFEDINIKNKTLRILDSKNFKSRIIPVSNQLNIQMEKFIKSNSISKGQYLFQNKNGDKYNYNKIWDIWKKILNNCNFDTDTNKYRIHDLRHHFAINCLNQLETRGYDIYVSLPLVSKYLGHSSIKETEYYLRLTKNYRDKIIKQTDEYIGNILVDVEYE